MVETRLHLDDGAVIVETCQDVEDVIERNRALQLIEQRSDWGRHVATIPNNILNRWLHEEWARGNVDLKLFSAEFDRIVQMKLDDPEWRFLRVDK